MQKVSSSSIYQNSVGRTRVNQWTLVERLESPVQAAILRLLRRDFHILDDVDSHDETQQLQGQTNRASITSLACLIRNILRSGYDEGVEYSLCSLIVA